MNIFQNLLSNYEVYFTRQVTGDQLTYNQKPDTNLDYF